LTSDTSEGGRSDGAGVIGVIEGIPSFNILPCIAPIVHLLLFLLLTLLVEDFVLRSSRLEKVGAQSNP
jgi:hypothetical protein